MPVSADQKTTKLAKRDDRRTKKGGENLRWWTEPAETLHESVQAVAKRIWDNLSRKRLENYVYARMYNNVDLERQFSSTGTIDGSGGYSDWNSSGRIELNVVQNCVDMAASMVAKNRPRPMFLTDGADYKTLQKAEKLTRYVAGVIDDCGLYAKWERVFTDGGVGGTGFAKFYVEDQHIKAERVHPNEILIDELEGAREKPSQIHQRKLMSRDELCEMFPDSEEQIYSANADKRAETRSVSDLIPVVESWHLPSKKGAKDGLHCITIAGATLMREVYTKDYYPIIPWRWYPSTLGYWGRGIAQEIGSIQRAINRTLSDIDESTENVAQAILWVPLGSNISEDTVLSNEIGRMGKYAGPQPPTFNNPPAQAEDVYSHVKWLVEAAYNIIGVNQSMAQGQKQPGIESGAGIREATDIASGRLQVIGQRAEQWFIDATYIIVDMSKDMYGADKSLSVSVKQKYGDGLERLKWADVDMDEDRFTITVFPVSGLPSTPSGRLQATAEYAQAGFFPKEWVMALNDFPDMKRFTRLETATQDLTQATVSKIKETGVYGIDLKPMDQMNLEEAYSIATKECVAARVEGCDEKTIALLIQYANEIQRLMPPPPGAAPPGPPAPGPMSGAPPGPPPPLRNQFDNNRVMQGAPQAAA